MIAEGAHTKGLLPVVEGSICDPGRAALAVEPDGHAVLTGRDNTPTGSYADWPYDDPLKYYYW